MSEIKKYYDTNEKLAAKTFLRKMGAKVLPGQRVAGYALYQAKDGSKWVELESIEIDGTNGGKSYSLSYVEPQSE